MRIDIWSDVVCPWCYLGKRRLEAALARLPSGDEVEVHWRAYQLDPSAPTEPQDLREALARKYGGRGRVAAMTSRLTELGRAEGIDYRWDHMQRVNTLDAHRLLAWTSAESGPVAQGTLQERLFLAYFTDGANVADHGELSRLAGEAGLDTGRAAAALASGAHAEEVAADVAEAARRDLTGVPAFVIEGQWLIPGAQEVDTLVSLLTRAHQRLATVHAAAAEACTVDDPAC